ncbi:MAG TPA: hypothetical protein ENJ46_02845 [Hellea balneolensis]|uniref:Uncharacterized protein n=1 Tax=Hellea balneolensis TaxID=287478 RepID=A0A7C3GKX9_9PROT|nr:hypothetical protein [Hellea balneolensis]
MRQSVFDYIGSLNTLIAVFIGAILATGGALVAEVIQERRNRKHREQDAARFFGDILLSIDQIIDFAFNSHTIGDQWGAMTLRIYKTALKEASVYERNRERLFDIQDMELRSRIHTHFLTETFPIEVLIENSEEIAMLEAAHSKTLKVSKRKQDAHKARIKFLEDARQAGVEALKREHAKTKDLCRELEIVAKTTFALHTPPAVGATTDVQAG